MAQIKLDGHTFIVRSREIYFIKERMFHPSRKWRFDYACPRYKLAVEIEGGAFIPGGGRHNRGQGFINDCEKYNAAVVLGWKLFRYPKLDSYKILADIEAMFDHEDALENARDTGIVRRQLREVHDTVKAGSEIFYSGLRTRRKSNATE